MSPFDLNLRPPGSPGVMCWRRSFPGDPSEARSVRRLVRLLLEDCTAVNEIVFATNEFFNNAIEHTASSDPGGHVHVELRCWEDKCVSVSVTDQGGTHEPQARDTMNELAESGYGLAAISGTASSWGWHGNDQGRTVTAVFML